MSYPVAKADVVRKERFVQNLTMGMGPVPAAKAAGFQGNLKAAVKRLMEDEWVQDALEAFRDEMREKYRFDRDKAVRMLIDAYEMSKVMADPKSMVAAVRELNEMHGHHEARKVDLSISGEVQRKLAHLSDEELAEQAGLVLDGEYTEVITDAPH